MTRANPRLVGGFILGGVSLALLGITWLASAHLFEKKHTFVVFFPQAVRGLEVGSAVTFSGVPVGQVKRIQVYMTGQNGRGGTPRSQIEVTIRVASDFVRAPPGVENEFEDLGPWELATKLRDQGLRAEVMNGSLVTGQLYIDLDFHPDLPARMADLKTQYPQLPSAPNPLEQLGDRVQETLDKISKLPLERVANDLAETLEAIRDLAREKEIRGALASASGAGREARRTFVDLDKLVLDAQAKLAQVDTGKVASDVSAALSAAQQSLGALQGAVEGTGSVEAQLNETLHEVGRAAAAVRALAEYLERHPEALLGGKPSPKAKEK